MKRASNEHDVHHTDSNPTTENKLPNKQTNKQTEEEGEKASTTQLSPVFHVTQPTRAEEEERYVAWDLCDDNCCNDDDDEYEYIYIFLR